jgi:hypothetical protein
MKQSLHRIWDPASIVNTMKITTSTCPVMSAESGSSQHATLKPHGVMFVDAHDRIPFNPGSGALHQSVKIVGGEIKYLFVA